MVSLYCGVFDNRYTPSSFTQAPSAASLSSCFHPGESMPASTSKRLTELCTNLHILTFSFQLRHAQLAGTHPMSGHSLTEHREVADAIRSGDPAHAEEVMRRHLRDGKSRVMALPDNAFA